MLDSFEVLNWLNQFDRLHLSRDARALTRAARDVRRSDAGVERIIARLEAIRQASGDPLEAAEISLHCAAVEIWRGMYVRAIRHAKEAGGAYRADDHRRAVARWLMGMAQWERLQNHSAYSNWDGARKLFARRLRFFRHSPNERGWYEEKLWLMEIELAGKPEEIYTWLNRFEESKLSPPSRQVVEAVQEKIRQRAYPDVYAMIRDLQEVNKWSKEDYERAEVFLECGLTAYQMGNIPAAIELLKRAVVDFSPGIGNKHKQVVARCMLGAVEWMDSTKHNQATIDWRRCVDEFEELRSWADKANEQQRKKWYINRRVILRTLLLGKL
ncbi:MAG: hypothetical protein ACOYZ8_07760 [Chloroflexota bacterium]